MKKISALRDPDVLLVGGLEIHRRGPEKMRPCLIIHVWCPHCRDHHRYPWDESYRPETAIGPVAMPCRCRPFDGKSVYLALDPEERDDQRRITETFRQSLRRYRIQRELERQLLESRELDPDFLRDYPDALDARLPLDHLQGGWLPPANTFTFAPSP